MAASKKRSPKRSPSKKSMKRGGKKSASKKSKKRSGSKKLRPVSMKRRLAQSDNPCRRYKKINCGSVDPNCQWKKRVGCSRRRGAATKGAMYEGPSMMEM